MKYSRIAGGFSVALLILTVSGCSTVSSEDALLADAMASIEAKIPTRERASVRVCESLSDPTTRITTFEDALNFATKSLRELQASDDPNGMRTSLMRAMIGLGDASAAGDASTYQSAVINLATVCTDVVSGEYGK